LYTGYIASKGGSSVYLVTWLEGEEVEYRLLSSEESLDEVEEEKNSIVVEFDA
jgi:hypothetical protein